MSIFSREQFDYHLLERRRGFRPEIPSSFLFYSLSFRHAPFRTGAAIFTSAQNTLGGFLSRFAEFSFLSCVTSPSWRKLTHLANSFFLILFSQAIHQELLIVFVPTQQHQIFAFLAKMGTLVFLQQYVCSMQ